MMKKIVLIYVILMIFVLAGCNTKTHTEELYKTSDFQAKSNEYIVTFDDYLREMVNAVSEKPVVKTDGSDDNIKGVQKTLEHYISIQEEYFSFEHGSFIAGIKQIVQNPENKLYAVELLCRSGWGNYLGILEFENGRITYAKDTGQGNDSLVQSSSQPCTVKLKGIDGYLLQTYRATHMGNGGMYLYLFDKECEELAFFEVAGGYQDSEFGFENWEEGGLPEHINVTVSGYNGEDGPGFLVPIYEDINGDGIDDIQFEGSQTISAEGFPKKHIDINLIYLYDSAHKTFVLDRENSSLPHNWSKTSEYIISLYSAS